MNAAHNADEEKLDPDIRELAEKGVALLKQGATCAGERSLAQARAFNHFLRSSLSGIQALTIRFERPSE